MSASARRTTSFLGVAAILILAFSLASPRWIAAFAAASPPPLPADLRATLIRAGLDPSAIAASGMNAAAVGPAVQAAAGAIDAQPSRLSAADSAYADARRESDRLRALIQSGRNNPEDVAAYQSADTALSSATSEREAALTAFFAAATANLTAEQRTALERIRANRSWILSPEFLVIERSQQEWVALRDALASERIAAKLGVELEPEVVAALATWRSNASVAAAKANLDGNLASVTAAWNSATTGE